MKYEVLDSYSMLLCYLLYIKLTAGQIHRERELDPIYMMLFIDY